MTSVAIQVLPSAENDQELCRIVDEVIAYIAGTGLRYEVGPFETTIEGDDYDQLMDIVKECQHVAVRAGAKKVSAYVKVVYRPEGEILSIDQKIGKYKKNKSGLKYACIYYDRRQGAEEIKRGKCKIPECGGQPGKYFPYAPKIYA